MAALCLGKCTRFIHHNYSFQMAWRLQLGQFRGAWFSSFPEWSTHHPTFTIMDQIALFVVCSCRVGYVQQMTALLFPFGSDFSRHLQIGGRTASWGRSDFNECMKGCASGWARSACGLPHLRSWLLLNHKHSGGCQEAFCFHTHARTECVHRQLYCAEPWQVQNYSKIGLTAACDQSPNVSFIHTHLACFFEWKTCDTGHWTPPNKASWDVEGHAIPARVTNIPQRRAHVHVGTRSSACMRFPTCTNSLICSDWSKWVPDVRNICSGSLLYTDTVIKWKLFPFGGSAVLELPFSSCRHIGHMAERQFRWKHLRVFLPPQLI